MGWLLTFAEAISLALTSAERYSAGVLSIRLVRPRWPPSNRRESEPPMAELAQPAGVWEARAACAKLASDGMVTTKVQAGIMGETLRVTERIRPARGTNSFARCS